MGFSVGLMVARINHRCIQNDWQKRSTRLKENMHVNKRGKRQPACEGTMSMQAYPVDRGLWQRPAAGLTQGKAQSSLTSLVLQ